MQYSIISIMVLAFDSALETIKRSFIVVKPLKRDILSNQIELYYFCKNELSFE